MGELTAFTGNQFVDYATRALLMHINGFKKIRSETHKAETLLSGVRYEYQGNDAKFIAREHLEQPDSNQPKAANIDDSPVTQAEWVASYSDMMTALDSYALTTAYFLKIQNYIPAVLNSATMGSGRSYSTPITDDNKELAYTPYLSLNVFNDTPYVMDILNQEINMAFGILDQIKLRFDGDTRDFLVGKKNREPDKFADKFYNCLLTEKHQYHSRIEYLFFEKFSIPLGIIGADDHVSKYILRTFQDRVTSPYFPIDAVTARLPERFPAIMFTQSDETQSISGSMRYNFMVFAHGALNPNGIVIVTPKKASAVQKISLTQ